MFLLRVGHLRENHLNLQPQRLEVRADSLQGSSTLAASASIFKHVPRRVRNVYYATPLVMPVYIDATDLARTIVLSE